MLRENVRLRVGWICLAVVGLAILVFGVVVLADPPSDDEGIMRADGLASLGLGLFGLAITVFPFRRRERWAWFVLWFYPAFWAVHWGAALPPGNDHVHQIVLLALSLAGLLLPVGEFFPGTGGVTDDEEQQPRRS